MNIDKLLNLFFHWNVFIIEALFGVVLLGIVFLAIRSFMRPEGHDSELNLGGIENSLKKLIENYSGNESASVQTEASLEGDAIMEEMATQIERLKLQLIEKTEEIEQLKTGTAVVSSNTVASNAAPIEAVPVKPSVSSPSGANEELEEKVRELEARLSEYSIIEDDIADLSFYKEETVRLQAEIDRLKAKLAEYEAKGAPSLSQTSAASSSSPLTAEESHVSPIVAPSSPVSVTAPASPPSAPAASVVQETPVNVPSEPDVAASSNTTSAPSVLSLDDDIMAEFERAVAEQKAMNSTQKVATELSPAAFTEEVPKAESIKNESAKLVENSQEPQSQVDSTGTLEEVVENGINLDKMLNEVSGLPEGSDVEVANVLEQTLDTEKLLKEATVMDRVEEPESIQGLEEFLKKEGA